MQDLLGSTTPRHSSTSSSSSSSLLLSDTTTTTTWTSRRVNAATSRRHRTDFQIQHIVGKGGFGTVYLVENRIDAHRYALKVVSMNWMNGIKRVLREVQTLAVIPSHEHVVRYYSAWVEESRENDDNDDNDDYDDDDGMIGGSSSSNTTQDTNNMYAAKDHSYDDDDDDDDDDDYDSATATMSHQYHRHDSEEKEDADDDNDNAATMNTNQNETKKTRPTCHLCHLSYPDWEVSFESWGLLDSVLQPMNLCVDCYRASLPDHIDPSKLNIRQHLGPYQKRLYILMEYCESTLHEVVQKHTQMTTTTRKPPHNNTNTSGADNDDNDDDNVNNTKTTTTTLRKEDEDEEEATARRVVWWSYFRQTVQGVAHLHQHNIIHRDIKPNNVFVTKNGIVKLGDLGLAITIDRNHTTNTNHNMNTNTNTDAENGDEDEQNDIQTKSNYENKQRQEDSSDDPRIQQQQQSSDVGTYLYRAPEIQTGNYDEKCDVYSLGILLFELFQNFETKMERAVVLSKFKNSGTATNTNTNNNTRMCDTNDEDEDNNVSLFYKRLAHKMIAFNPKDRPSCNDILQEVDAYLLRVSYQSHPTQHESLSSLASSLSQSTITIEKQQQQQQQLSASILGRGESATSLSLASSTTTAAAAANNNNNNNRQHDHDALLREKDQEITRLKELLIANGISF